MPSRMQEFKSGQQQYNLFHKMNGLVVQSGIEQPTDRNFEHPTQNLKTQVKPVAVASSFDPQVQPPTIVKPSTNNRDITNKASFRGKNQPSPYDTTFENGTPQWKEQYTVIPIAGRNEGFKTSMDYRFWEYQGVVSETSHSRVKQADSYDKTTLAMTLGSLMQESAKTPSSTAAIKKATGEWR